MTNLQKQIEQTCQQTGWSEQTALMVWNLGVAAVKAAMGEGLTLQKPEAPIPIDPGPDQWWECQTCGMHYERDGVCSGLLTMPDEKGEPIAPVRCRGIIVKHSRRAA